MHVTFGRVVAEDTVRHDNFFALGEPAVFAPETGGGLVGRWWEVEAGRLMLIDTLEVYRNGKFLLRGYSDQPGQNSFKQKQPPPTSPAGYLSHVQNAVGKERADNTSADIGSPKEAKTDR